ncbi:MAG: hypothetical protein AMS14_07575 [Planctomycetes bacterium DG_20]|nr:MAG: hypothetical protein AMS14_07575 [Planctomycetes bacterium DG_20]
MPPRRRATNDLPDLLGLADNKTRPRLIPRHLRRIWRVLPRRDRYLLALLHRRGASLSELSGLLGVSRITVRRMAERAVRRATDPENLAILASWRRLAPEEQRLAYVHRFMGMPLREIARLRLVPTPGATGSKAAGVNVLRRMLKRIRRKARLPTGGQARRSQDAEPSQHRPDSGPPSPGSGSSAG